MVSVPDGSSSKQLPTEGDRATALTWSERLTGLAPGSVDVHTHAIDPGLPELGAGFPWVERTGPNRARIMLDGHVYREIDDRSWSPAARLRDMDDEGIAVQVASPIPVTLCHDAPLEGAIALSCAQNDYLAAFVAEVPDRFLALGAVPLQAPQRAAAELVRCVRELGFLGVEIGTQAGGRDLSDPFFAPLFAAADELGAVLFVHPVDRTLDPRLAQLGLGFGLGMPGETAVAGAALLISGTLDGVPNARVVLAHGGSLPSVLPRVARGQLIAAPDTATQDLAVSRARRLWSDSLTYDVDSLRLAVTRFGADHVVLGTDYPFAAREKPPGAVLSGLDDELRARIQRHNTDRLCTGTGRAASGTTPH